MRTALLVAMASFLGGCLGTEGFEQRLRAQTGELMYLREMRAPERRPGTVSLGTFSVEPELPPATTVRKTGGWVVPLLLVNAWQGEYRSSLGAAQLANDYRAFMKESLEEDLRRAARYRLVDGSGDLRVDVNVTKIEMSAPIAEGGHFVFLLLAVGWGNWIRAGPVDVTIEGETIVTRAGQEPVRSTVVGRSRSRILYRKGTNADTYVADFTTAMIESLSLAVKGFNGAVVEEVNRL
ncbi:MAG TPA: hypothetical protein VF841_11480 [Anaeromyxobacter sp.]